MLRPLSNSNYSFGLHILLLCELESADLVTLASACGLLAPTRSVFVFHLSSRADANTEFFE
jgi:hypothetical protein